MSTSYLHSAKSDSFAAENQAHKNFGSLHVLKVNHLSGSRHRAYVFFPMPNKFSRDYVLVGELRIHVKGNWSGVTLTAKRVTTSWSENRLTWSNQPTTTDTHAANGTVDVTGNKIIIDIKDMLNDIAGGAAYHGVQLTIDADTEHRFYSSEADRALQPHMFIEYALQPDPPEHLHPNSVQLYDSKPRLRWLLPKTDKGVKQAYSRVQIGLVDVDDHVDWTTPEYDSGQQANTEHDWDLEATAYAGVPDGERRAWRVKFWNEHGVPTDWSDDAEFSYASAGVVSITDPVDGAVVVDSTPSLLFTYTPGGNGNVDPAFVRQTVSFLKDDGTFSKPVEDTDWEKFDGAYEFTPERGDITAKHRTYKVTIFADDGKDQWGFARNEHDSRVPFDQVTFTFDHTSDVFAPYNLAQDNFGPGIVLEWDSDLAVPPDYWALIVDGEMINDSIEGDDALDSYGDDAIYYSSFVDDEDSDGIADSLDPTLDGSPGDLGIVFAASEFDPHGQHFTTPDGTEAGLHSDAFGLTDHLQVVTLTSDVNAVALGGGALLALRLKFFDGADVLLGTFSTTTATLGAQTLAVVQAAPANTAYCKAYWHVVGGSGGEVTFANVLVEQIVGHYSWTWHGARPFVAHQVAIRAKISGVGWSDESNTIDAEFDPVGIYLVEEHQNLWVPIMGDALVNETLSRDGNTFYLINRRDPVRIDGLPRGYYGKVQGQIVGDAFDSAQGHLIDLETLVGKFSTSPHLRLIYGKQSYPVVIADLARAQMPIANEDVYQVEFDFWQVGEFTVPETG